MKRNLLLSSAIILFMALSVSLFGQEALELPNPASPKAYVEQTVGISTIGISYSRPSVTSQNGEDREGQIWGDLVPYGMSMLGYGNNKPGPWRAGANENTVITFSHDAKIEGKSLPAGSYGFHIIVKEDGTATLIFSKNYRSWGSYWYEESEDALRVDIKTEEVSRTEALTYSFIDLTANSATVALDWEKKRFPFTVQFDVVEIVLANISNQLRNTAGFSPEGYMNAAMYAVRANSGLDLAADWADRALAMEENFGTLQVKSAVLRAQGNKSEAAVYMSRAINHPSASLNSVYGYIRQLIADKNLEKAAEAASILDKKWPGEWLTYHGNARVQSAMGQYKKALKLEQQALKIAPASSKKTIEGYIETLKQGKDFN